jgi:hypothetical protein
MLASTGALAFVVTIASLVPVSVVGQAAGGRAAVPKTAASTWTPPRTPDGQPDLQGTWVNNSVTPLERPKALEGRQSLTDEEVAELKKRAARIFDVNGKSDLAAGDDVFLAALANPDKFTNPNATGSPVAMIERVFDNRTSLIVDPSDGRLPAPTPQVQQKRAAAARSAQRLPAGPEDLSNPNRCITFGVPRLGGNAASYNPYYQIVQTSGYVVLVGEVIHDARIIPLDRRPHLAQNLRPWHGDSRGRWERDTLVVETTNFSPKSNFLGSAESLHLVERFTRVAPDTIDYEITVSDPTIWAQSWTALIRLKQTQDRMFEYACHEGNLHTVSGILGAARADEQAAEEAAKKKPK